MSMSKNADVTRHRGLPKRASFSVHKSTHLSSTNGSRERIRTIRPASRQFFAGAGIQDRNNNDILEERLLVMEAKNMKANYGAIKSQVVGSHTTRSTRSECSSAPQRTGGTKCPPSPGSMRPAVPVWTEHNGGITASDFNNQDRQNLVVGEQAEALLRAEEELRVAKYQIESLKKDLEASQVQQQQQQRRLEASERKAGSLLLLLQGLVVEKYGDRAGRRVRAAAGSRASTGTGSGAGDGDGGANSAAGSSAAAVATPASRKGQHQHPQQQRRKQQQQQKQKQQHQRRQGQGQVLGKGKGGDGMSRLGSSPPTTNRGSETRAGDSGGTEPGCKIKAKRGTGARHRVEEEGGEGKSADLIRLLHNLVEGEGLGGGSEQYHSGGGAEEEEEEESVRWGGALDRFVREKTDEVLMRLQQLHVDSVQQPQQTIPQGGSGGLREEQKPPQMQQGQGQEDGQKE